MDSSPQALSATPTAEALNQSARDADKALLAEARATRDMIVGFRSAVESGRYDGAKMLDLAKGLAFIEAILKQNNAHIQSLQERLGK